MIPWPPLLTNLQTAIPRPSALKQLILLPLSSFEEKILNEFAQKPPSPMTIEFSALAILQDLICVRLIQGGRYTEAIKQDKLFSSTTPSKHLNETRDRSKMVQDVYAALPAVEKALLDLEIDPSFTQEPPLAPKPTALEARRGQLPTEAQDTSLSQSWEEVHVPDTLVAKSTPLRDVRVPITPRFGTNVSTAIATPPGPPILPINFNPFASGSKPTPRKSFPLSASVLGSAKPRTSMSGVGTRMSFGTAGIASPASGMMLPPSNLASSHGPGHAFVSASKQQNAFYQPPAKTNGVKRAFEEDAHKSPEPVELTANPAGVSMDMDTEKEDDSFEQEPERGRKSNVTENTDDEENGLQYSVFSSKAKQAAPKSSSTASKKAAKQKAPPGSFGSDHEDAVDEDHDVEHKKSISRTRSSRPTRASKAQPAPAPAPSKPPAKKARQSKGKDLSRSIPGGLMDEDDDEEHEEEDEVPPLPAPRAPSPVSRSRPVRKARSSVSVDTADEMEGIQTRRSTRLTKGASGSVHGGSPEPPAPKTRKSGRASTSKKKR